MIKLSEATKNKLISLLEEKNIFLEGNIIKIVDDDGDENFRKYLKQCLELDKAKRKKRLQITNRIQKQNKELILLNQKNDEIRKALELSVAELKTSSKQIENQNIELLKWKTDNEKIKQDLLVEMKKSESARLEAENAKETAENDLELLQKKNQYELINFIVWSALATILIVTVSVTAVFLYSIYQDSQVEIISATWSNIILMLVSNAFSIVGVVMGLKNFSNNE